MGLGCLLHNIVNGARQQHSYREYNEEYESPIRQGDKTLQALKMRFVNGEISEDEYQRMKKILLEN